MKHPLRRILLGIFVLAFVGALVYGFLPQPVAVDLALVERGSLRVTVDEDGKTRIRERYVVSTPLAGRLLRIELDPGDPVEAGKTLIAAIEPSEPELLDERTRAQAEARVKAAEAANEQARAQLKRAQAAYDFAAAEFLRTQGLLAKKMVSRDVFDKAEYERRAGAEELQAARSAVRIAEYELELAKAALLSTRPNHFDQADTWRFEILSPIDGRVLQVFEESATVVPAGARLMELGDPGDLEVVVDVLSSDAARIRPGAEVVLEHWGGEPLPGRVRLIEPAAFTKVSALGVEEQRVNVIVDLLAPPEERPGLGDGFRVEARIVTWEGEKVLKAPAGALFRHSEDWAVFVDQGGTARLRRIEAGHSNGLETEILAGLEEGQRVVLHPSDRIEDGVAIAPR